MWYVGRSDAGVVQEQGWRFRYCAVQGLLVLGALEPVVGGESVRSVVR